MVPEGISPIVLITRRAKGLQKAIHPKRNGVGIGLTVMEGLW